MSGVFQNIHAPTPRRPASVSSPVFGAGAGHTRWVERGWGVISSEDARHCSVLYICKYFVGFTVIFTRHGLIVSLHKPPTHFTVKWEEQRKLYFSLIRYFL
jgi:hypothetical protein